MMGNSAVLKLKLSLVTTRVRFKAGIRLSPDVLQQRPKHLLSDLASPQYEGGNQAEPLLPSPAFLMLYTHYIFTTVK